jgi:hypothetical protein
MKRDKKDMKSILNKLFPPPPEAEMEAAGEEVLKRLHALMPKEIAEFNLRYAGQGTAESPKDVREDGVLQVVRDDAQSLRDLDPYVLTAVRLLGGNCHAGHIHAKVEELTSKEHDLNAVYSSLDRLEKQALVSVRTAPVDHFERYVYTITTMGAQVLALVRPAHAIEELGDFA